MENAAELIAIIALVGNQSFGVWQRRIKDFRSGVVAQPIRPARTMEMTAVGELSDILGAWTLEPVWTVLETLFRALQGGTSVESLWSPEVRL